MNKILTLCTQGSWRSWRIHSTHKPVITRPGDTAPKRTRRAFAEHSSLGRWEIYSGDLWREDKCASEGGKDKAGKENWS